MDDADQLDGLGDALRGPGAGGAVPVAEALALFEDFQELVTTNAPSKGDKLGKLAVFAGVREFPVRVKCATLPWHTLKNALKGSQDVARTE